MAHRHFAAEATASTIALTARLIARNVKTRPIATSKIVLLSIRAYAGYFDRSTLCLPVLWQFHHPKPTGMGRHLEASQSTLTVWTWPVARYDSGLRSNFRLPLLQIFLRISAA